MSSLTPNPLWTIPPKQRLGVVCQTPQRTRVAPSPTGHVHLGTVRTALHNKLMAQASGGDFLLRIDDTDATRNDQCHVDLIHSTFDWLGLGSHQVYVQSSRLSNHQHAIDHLLASNLAHISDGAVKLNNQVLQLVPKQFFDLANGVCQVSATTLDHMTDLVLMRQNNTPTYHFASVVDDIDMQVSCIVRGADHLSNTPKHIAIALALAKANYPLAQDFLSKILFAHVGLIMKDGKKLSKRDGDSSMATYQHDDPRAILHWALQLGWGHPSSTFDRDNPVLDMPSMTKLFAQGGLRGSSCNINLGKLQSLKKLYAKK